MAAYRCASCPPSGPFGLPRSSSYYVGVSLCPTLPVFFQGNAKTTQTPRMPGIELLFGR
ncbi:hypothetical protein M419DRAFT_124237 [Trichoderma reesei RUT C-30]|uniref:Uncharacterized protein n=1 Tax=Hypocrea jecorina (strain ATCC 56765 / BCRC 32924 / NRRL 11460 / Rut C-30) TaxID=1344414 RepID=A0A024S684_HYPJR|nr:hypothetical protein M419DRAFT_124237 [Trichoderma reesei RUT C-30]